MSTRMKRFSLHSILRLLVAAISIPLLTGLFVLFTTGEAAAHASHPALQYVALGDSLPFGYQPDNDFTHGYASDLFQTLQTKQGYGTFANFSCSDDTTATFINGDPTQSNSQRGCLVPEVQTSSQLSVAKAYLQVHASDIGLVTLQIGIDDFLNSGAINLTNCQVDPAIFNAQLTTVDTNLTQTILPQLKQALSAAPKHQAKLVLVDYFNPLQQLCPNTTAYINTLNQHLKQDAHGYAAFVGINHLFTTQNLCQLTWICNDLPPTLGDIHPRDEGYALIADTIYNRIFCHREIED
ncbi:hypothetical protein KDA_71220 [Dictyobacter alpinus]|uniref:Uncharacterized protein n=1 Tax=Dictyobacter alpinus TaxID=2014873 RepID=A0A402BJV5_9CHLR|nr:SGNH/GDSL hydrolase family protein [Dictyobacter alpinus]GCE31638.1 hypothetical protein KDA_71220 [Dictyobacter alpinus]